MPDKNRYALDNPGFENDVEKQKQNELNGVSPDNKDDDASKEDPEVEMEMDDPWKVNFISKDYTPWSELDSKGKALRGLGYSVKIVLAIGCLYLFICSLDFLSSAFKLLGGEAAGKVFQQSDILTNPIAGLMMGVLVTVLVQSSSTSTSIVVSMVGAGILDIPTAVPIVMGANIGTSVTNTIVAVGQISDKNEFRRAFAGATVHDMFNWLCVIILLPIEVATGYLEHLSSAIVDSLPLETQKGAKKDILKVVTKPFTELIIQINKDAITDIAHNEAEEGYRIMKLCCDKDTPEECCDDKVEELHTQPGFEWWNAHDVYSNQQMEQVCPVLRGCVERDGAGEDPAPGNCSLAWSIKDSYDEIGIRANCSEFIQEPLQVELCNNKTITDDLILSQLATPSQMQAVCSNLTEFAPIASRNESMTKCMDNSTWYITDHTIKKTVSEWSCSDWAKKVEEKDCNSPCDYLFKPLADHLGDREVGAILLVISLAILCICLVSIVKLLHSLLKGPMAVLIKKFINADFPGPLKYLTGYVAILIGAGLTIVVQSSSIFTSTMTPLVGIGVIELDRMYPLTLGSNIGTTTTAILSSLANSGKDLQNSLQVAFCHLFFNITGIVLFYPIVYLRFPIPLAKFLGNCTAEYRWFAIVYILLMFFLFPLGVFGLSVAGWYVLAAVLIPIVVLCIVVGIVKVIQNKCPNCLPKKLRTWKWLPEPLRSLRPYDKVMKKVFFCKRFETKPSAADKKEQSNGTANGTASTRM